MSAPVIGVCAVVAPASWGYWTQQRASIVSEFYTAKVQRAGGIPILFMPDPQLSADPDIALNRIDGLLLIGGDDLDPTTYGRPRDPLTERTVLERDRFEIVLARRAMQRDIPTLGICRGLQIMNVAQGGTLVQHLDSTDLHRANPGYLDESTYHDVIVQQDTLAARAIGTGRQRVNSHHHQGIDRVGTGAIVTARAAVDELPEALEWPDRRHAIGVQWHPEAMVAGQTIANFVHAAASV